MYVVWFKRDLRLVDHAALSQALANGPTLPLYIIEPELWQQPDLSRRQYDFLSECLIELKAELQGFGYDLVIRVGDVITVFDKLRLEQGIDAIWSHQETWNNWTYQRDHMVAHWCQQHDILWQQPAQHGVIRGLRKRSNWSSHWYKFMSRPILPAPKLNKLIQLTSAPLPTADQLGLANDSCPYRQAGGRQQAIHLLQSFLLQRGEGYTREMSSPLTAFESCSRLSPHFAFGTVSMREVFHAVSARQVELKQQPRGTMTRWRSAMRSVASRLRWHCHFIQKLETEPKIEMQNMHSAYNGLRQQLRQDYFTAWCAGKTGFPMIDACMRALQQTGWINFRMRAMLMSFASYHLWLPWQATALHLATLFVDYEPGIHYSQCQMQSGTTGINSIRIYNPIKQGLDQDPDGQFIRQWVSELQAMPVEFIHMPWLQPKLMCGYPMPIVDEANARKVAASQIYQIRKQIQHREEAAQVVEKHASRRRPPKRKRSSKGQASNNPQQVELAL